MYAYHIRDLDAAGGPQALVSHPIGKRIAHAGPWQLSRHREGGSLVSWKGASVDPATYGPGEETFDGMFFLPWKESLPPVSLARAFARTDPRAECLVKLACGIEISIALATHGARRRTFSGGSKVGDLVDEFSLLARDLLARMKADDDMHADDARFSRYLFLAVSMRYRVTEEALDRWGILSTADDGPIWWASLGADPKASAAAGS